MLLGHGTDVVGQIRSAAQLSRDLSASLSVAAYAQAVGDLAELSDALRLTPGSSISKLMILDLYEDVTPVAMLAEARTTLQELPARRASALLAGTDYHFAELNRAARLGRQRLVLPGDLAGPCV